MNSRERILAAINHIEPDKVPLDFGGHRSSGIMAIAYRKLRDHLGMAKTPIKVYDMIQQLAIIDDDVLELFGIDTIQLQTRLCTEEKYWKSWRLPDGSECLIPAEIDVRLEEGSWFLYSKSNRKVGVQRPGMLYFDQIYWPYSDGIPSSLSNLSEALSDQMWTTPAPIGIDQIGYANLKKEAKALRASTDRAIVAIFGGSLFETSQKLCRTDNLLMWMLLEPEKVHRLYDNLVELYLETLNPFLESVGSSVDVVLFLDDLGMQSGPQISPELYRQFLKPRHAELWSKAKQLADIKLNLHCCGGIRPLIDDFIEIGLDSINPVQTSCNGMEPSGLKKDFGKKMCFWGGGCDTQQILPQGSTEEIRKHVRERCRILSKGGGFIFQQVHNIMADIPPENILSMFEAVKSYNENTEQPRQ